MKILTRSLLIAVTLLTLGLGAPPARAATVAPGDCAFSRGTTTCVTTTSVPIGRVLYGTCTLLGTLGYPDAPCLIQRWQERRTTTTVATHHGNLRAAAPVTTSSSTSTEFVRLPDAVFSLHSAALAQRDDPYPPAP